MSIVVDVPRRRDPPKRVERSPGFSLPEGAVAMSAMDEAESVGEVQIAVAIKVADCGWRSALT